MTRICLTRSAATRKCKPTYQGSVVGTLRKVQKCWLTEAQKGEGLLSNGQLLFH